MNDDVGCAQLHPHVFSRIHNFNNLAMNSISSLFSAPPSSRSSQLGATLGFGSTGYDANLWNHMYDIESVRTPNALEPEEDHHQVDYRHREVFDIGILTAETSTPTQTRSNSPVRSNCFQDAKRILTNFARSRHIGPDSYGQIHLGHSISDESRPIPANLRSSMIPSSVAYTPGSSDSDHFVTPPLTPDILDGQSPASSSLCVQDISHDIPYHPYRPGGHRLAPCFSHDENPPDVQSHSLEIKEGKKPARVSCHDTLAEDALGSTPRSPAPMRSQGGAPTEDRDELWYGLEYTLELSSRERRPSDTQSFSPGEHSKSRESWAAIHQGTVHPFYEDEDYYQWKNWHRYLDRQDERRKHRKGFEFKAKSKELAWCYADEFKTRDIMYWQKEEYGTNTRDVIEHLKILAETRPDPYLPPMNHNLAWYLKRSRSVACLRELRSSSLPHTNLTPDQDHGFAALENVKGYE